MTCHDNRDPRAGRSPFVVLPKTQLTEHKTIETSRCGGNLSFFIFILGF